MPTPLEAGAATTALSYIRNLRRVVPSHLGFDAADHEYNHTSRIWSRLSPGLRLRSLAHCLAEDIQYLTLLRAFYNRGLIVLS